MVQIPGNVEAPYRISVTMSRLTRLYITYQWDHPEVVERGKATRVILMTMFNNMEVNMAVVKNASLSMQTTLLPIHLLDKSWGFGITESKDRYLLNLNSCMHQALYCNLVRGPRKDREMRILYNKYDIRLDKNRPQIQVLCIHSI
jgi:hypothetical protein